MSLENTLKVNCDIKEQMDPENRSGQADGDLGNTTVDHVKTEYINECYSDVKIEEQSIDEEEYHLKNVKNSCHSHIRLSNSEGHLKGQACQKLRNINPVTVR